MDIQRIAAFSQGSSGGNPAGVVLLRDPATEAEMARVAAEVGFSETAFALPEDAGGRAWRVRYFSPESEVPFCGHATIALGAALGQQNGAGRYKLTLNDARITVEAATGPEGMQATLSSPPTHSRAVSEEELAEVLTLFALTRGDLDPRLAPARIHGGADHIVLPLKDRAALAAMTYDLDAGRAVMRRHGLVTVMLVFIEGAQDFAVRNAFASGGVLEDPATGAAAAAFAGYLRDAGWPHGGAFTIRQGEDMGSPSLIRVDLDDTKGAPVRVSGGARVMG
ncbi:PhzF family phenazine biosynthesis protein [Marinibacterium profundimaris]|uniref:PhzF family phenazine biosynthesis protein n=1 Tax=Marinibacterium profundimaris TaxID=1679460 RepID=A0A225NMN6_9RHOB|nr:PhzF family phenazine biosynthesis protein [Marinibacterium profundimaris]OWU73439.1 PhzF family phenazine biosynthesis protein [Marinibacterium profundimaris]